MSAEFVFVDGPVHGHPGVDALAVAGERIVALGPDARDLIGPATEVVALRGGRLVPGFQDAHVHTIWGGLELGTCNLAHARTEAEYLAIITRYAAAEPDRAWVTGGGWAMEAFPGGQPSRASLDAAVPDRGVYLLNRDHHGAWVNSYALARAGIDAGTPDPVGGRIERDARGEPTGMLQEAAVDLVGRLVPEPSAAELATALDRGQALLHSYGITAWQDAIVGAALGQPDLYQSYVDASADGRLTGRVRGALWWRRDAGLEQLDELIERRAGAAAAGGRFRATTVKIMIDGICENHTAALGSSYLDGCGQPDCELGAADHELGTCGLTFVDSDRLAGYVTALDAAGFQVHFHALGDRAVRLSLDAVAAARATNATSDRRHHLAHVQLVDPADRPRFAALDATANIQALWAGHEPQMDDLTIPFLGARRAAWQYPFAALHAAGARLAAGSDWPVTTPDPFAAIHTAVNRIQPGTGYPPFLPEQRLDLATAIRAYTAGSAYVNGLDDTGVLRIGAYADLAVLDRDPFAAPVEELAETRVRQTYVAGARVYDQG